jgi:hypothetical protein
MAGMNGYYVILINPVLQRNLLNEMKDMKSIRLAEGVKAAG